MRSLENVLKKVGAILWFALTLPFAMSWAQSAPIEQILRPSITLTVEGATDSVKTVVGDKSSFVVSYKIYGAHNCNLVSHDHGENVVTSVMLPNTLVVDTIGPNRQWYPTLNFRTTLQVICYDIHGEVIGTSRTMVIRRG